MSRTIRRTFLKQFAAATAALAGVGAASEAATQADPKSPVTGEMPWYRRTLRWGQTNITEIDPASYDIGWWREHWKRTRVQGVILNAGGIVAYYPSKHPLHYRPPLLGDRDLYGELAKAAHDDGLMVFARMDSNRTHEAFYKAHPDWFAVNASGKALPRRRSVRHLCQQPLLRAVYPQHLAGNYRAVASRGDHRQ